MTYTRREGLALAGSLAAAGIASSATPALAADPAPTAGLHRLARAKGLRFGSCFAWSQPGADRGSFANPAYADLLTRDCGLLVPENEMKWQAIQPTPAKPDFTRVDAMMRWADRQRMPVRGHNLLWHQPKWMPRWLETHDFGSRPATEASTILKNHIEAVCQRYGARIDSYDVVNEAVKPDDGSRYDTALSRAIGGPEATIDLAFRIAREAAPHAELVYNDYMSWEPGNARHRDGVLSLLEGFRRRNVPVDALGVQSHIVTQGPDGAASARALEGDWRRFLDRVTAMGYRLVVTELDVRDNQLPADPAVRDAAVAAYTRGYLDVMLSYPALRDVLVWGMTDRYSWIDHFEARKDGQLRRPCPYDRRFARKPMYDAIAAALRAAPPRTAPSRPPLKAAVATPAS